MTYIVGLYRPPPPSPPLPISVAHSHDDHEDDDNRQASQMKCYEQCLSEDAQTASVGISAFGH